MSASPRPELQPDQPQPSRWERLKKRIPSCIRDRLWFSGYEDHPEYSEAWNWFKDEFHAEPGIDYSTVQTMAEKQLDHARRVTEQLDGKADSLLKFSTVLIGTLIAVSKAIEVNPGDELFAGCGLLLAAAGLMVFTRIPASQPRLASPKKCLTSLEALFERRNSDDEDYAARLAGYAAADMHVVAEGTHVLNLWKARNISWASWLVFFGLVMLLISLNSGPQPRNSRQQVSAAAEDSTKTADLPKADTSASCCPSPAALPPDSNEPR